MICYFGYIMMQILEKSGSYIFVLSTTIIRSFSERYNTYGWYVKYNLTLDILKIILLNDLSLRCLIHILLLHNTSCLCSQVPIRNSYIFCDKSCVLKMCLSLSLEHEENSCVTVNTKPKVPYFYFIIQMP